MVQTSARIFRDIDTSNILSLASDTPVDVRVEHDKSRWELESYRRNLLDKFVDVQVHSLGFSSVNFPKQPPKLDCEALFDTLPPIETKGVYL